jgi:hypothetical protein
MIKTLDSREHETGQGTKYTIEDWRCSVCEEVKQTLYIDGEACFGDTQAAKSHFGGTPGMSACADCILFNEGHPPKVDLETREKVKNLLDDLKKSEPCKVHTDLVQELIKQRLLS